jgi:protein gp37
VSLGATGIPYADYGWNIVRGCSKDGRAGCLNCWAARQCATRLKHLPEYAGLALKLPPYLDHTGTIRPVYDWTGEVRFDLDELERPLHTRKPGVVFTVPRGDLFHEAVTDEQIAQVFGVMALGEPDAILRDGRWWPTSEPHHTYLVLTKRHARMRSLLSNPEFPNLIGSVAGIVPIWPMPHLWPIVSIWDQPSADAAIPDLLATPAAVRGVSVEPMLGPVALTHLRWPLDQKPYVPQTMLDSLDGRYGDPGIWQSRTKAKLDWVILGGESGPGARPMQPEWALDVYRQCKAAGVPFYWKQAGSWLEKQPPVPGMTYCEMEGTRECPEVTP